MNDIFAGYFTYFYLPVLLGFLPITITSIFTLLALHQIMAIAANQRMDIVRFSRDRQLTAMAFVRVLFIIITTIPFVSVFIYVLTTSAKNEEETARNQLIYTRVTLFNYESYSVSF